MESYFSTGGMQTILHSYALVVIKISLISIYQRILSKWIEQSKMRFRPQSLVNAPPPDVKINDICLTHVKVQKYLGVIFDDQLRACGGWIMSQLFVKRFLFICFG